MNFEPVGSAAVARTRFGHADHEALSESAGFASCPVLLIDDTLAVVLAFGYGVQIVVRSAEE